MSLRDPEFIEALEGFYATSQYPESPRLPQEQRMRVAIMQYVPRPSTISPVLFSFSPPASVHPRAA